MTRYEQLKRDLLQNFKEFQDIKAPGGSDLANEIVASKMARSIVDAIPASTFNVVGEMPCSQINVYDKNVGDLFTTIDAGNLFGAVTLTVNKGWIVWWSGDRFVKVYEGVQGGGSSVTVDQSLDITSANPIANAPVAQAIVEVNRRIDEIEPGENVQSDWAEADAESPAYIKNKPEIPPAITVDSALSDTSTNPVQNKVINSALSKKVPIIRNASDMPDKGGLSAYEIPDVTYASDEEGTFVVLWDITSFVTKEIAKNKGNNNFVVFKGFFPPEKIKVTEFLASWKCMPKCTTLTRRITDVIWRLLQRLLVLASALEMKMALQGIISAYIMDQRCILTQKILFSAIFRKLQVAVLIAIIISSAAIGRGRKPL